MEENNKTILDNKKIAIGILLFLAAIWLTCYSAADVEGRIVNAKTGEPIEGAVVVGIWQLESQGFEHSYGKAIHVVESVSDAEGHYRLEGFVLKFAGHLMGSLKDSDPLIRVFAEGYRPQGASRDPILEPGKGFRRVSPLNGEEIRLKREAMENWGTARLWRSGINTLVSNGGCELTQLSSLKALIMRIEQRYMSSNNTPKYKFMDAKKEYLGAVRIYKGATTRCVNGEAL